MPELHAETHIYGLLALSRQSIEVLDYPAEYFLIMEETTELLLENGTPLLLENEEEFEIEVTYINQETNDHLLMQASTGLMLAYKVTAEKHNYVLTALTKFPASPVFEVVEGFSLMEDGDFLFQETGDKLIYTDIRGN